MSKLHGAVAAVIIGSASAILFLCERRTRSEYAKFSIVTVATAGLALWPYALAWLYTGNPVFPFFNLIFKSPYYGLTNFIDGRWTGHWSPWVLFDMTFHSSEFLECADGALGFSLFVFLAAGIVAAICRRNAIVLFCIGIALLVMIAVSLQEQYLRYLFIFTPPLMIGIAYAIDELGQDRLWRILVAVAVTIVIVLNVLKFPTAGWIIGPSDMRAIFDSASRRDFEIAQAPERIANQIINDLAGPSAKVLYITHPFAALLVGTAIYANMYNTAFARDFANIKSERDLDTLLRRVAPTYIIFNPKIRGQLYEVARDYLEHGAILVTQIGDLSIYRTPNTAK